ncbi:MAG TPA: orotate phosphoribosyltransferase [Methanomicrobiales archaeon]|nr:orotate phosphoribosyltransferase [Methanomicrobiales archaeon]
MVNVLASLLAVHGAVRRGDFLLASGIRSSVYVDIKSALTDPGVLSAVALGIAGRSEFEVVAGVAVGGIPIAVTVSLAAGKPYAIVRRDEKGHGTGGKIVGGVAGLSTLLVEDVTTSGGSVLSAVRILREAGAKVDTVITVVDREEGAAASLAAEGVTLIPLVTLKELLGED